MITVNERYMVYRYLWGAARARLPETGSHAPCLPTQYQSAVKALRQADTSNTGPGRTANKATSSF